MTVRSIGDILIAQGVITRDQYIACDQQAREENQTLEQCLIEKNFTTAQDIARAYATYADMGYVEAISDKMADADLLARVPLKFLRDNVVMPCNVDGKHTIVTANPFDYQPLDELNLLLGGGFQYAVTTSDVILDAINRYYPLEGSKQVMEELEEEQAKEIGEVAFEDIEEKDILAMATEAPIIKLVNHILFQAVKREASDIHIEPFEKELRVRYRIDGVMHEVMRPPKRIQGALVSRIKIMANLNIAEKRIPQDGRIPIKVADKAFDIRVSILPVTFGERIVMRLLDKTKSLVALDKMGMSERDLKLIERAIHEPNGIILVTGPTGSGKTTTLYSVLSALNNPEVNIITVEDPVEYQIQGIGQVQVKEKVGMTFAAALRSILRQDPDIVMIGETRDTETAQIAIQAALTGHLVLSTLHTNSAPATITRLIDMGIEPFLIASSLTLVLAQRLVRRLCNACKVAYEPSRELLEQIGITPEQAKDITFYKPVGCPECLENGYKGRLPIFEVMQMSEGVARLTLERADMNEIKKQAIKDGMSTLVQDGIAKIARGLTTIDEVMSVATVDISLEA